MLLSLSSCKNSDSNTKPNVSTTTITDSDIYEIVNLILDETDNASKIDGLKTNPYKYILDKDLEPLFNRVDSIALLKTDTLFSKEDLKFINKQINSRKDFKFKSDFIKSKKIIPAEVIQNIMKDCEKNGGRFYDKFHEKFGDDLYYTIGLPVFSKDKKTVFIKFDSFGSGRTIVYKKIKNNWKYYCLVCAWQA